VGVLYKKPLLPHSKCGFWIGSRANKNHKFTFGPAKLSMSVERNRKPPPFGQHPTVNTKAVTELDGEGEKGGNILHL